MAPGRFESLSLRLTRRHHRPTLPDPGEIPLRVDVTTNRDNRDGDLDRPIDLAIATIKLFHDKEYQDLSDEQKQAIELLKQWFSSNDIITCSTDSIKECILLLSKAFFLQDIEPEMTRISRPIFEQSENSITLGSSRHLDDGRVLIQIDPRDWSDLKGVEDHAAAQFSTLVHECLHAYFSLFCCDCERHAIKGCTNRDEESLWRPGTGHDIAWFHLAAALEIALEKHFGLGANLAVFSSLLREYEKPGHQVYSSGEWKQFFALHSRKDVDALLDRLDFSECRALVEHLADPERKDVIAAFYDQHIRAARETENM